MLSYRAIFGSNSRPYLTKVLSSTSLPLYPPSPTPLPLYPPLSTPPASLSTLTHTPASLSTLTHTLASFPALSAHLPKTSHQEVIWFFRGWSERPKGRGLNGGSLTAFRPSGGRVMCGRWRRRRKRM